jgi:cytoskeletal protein CcmA (bactofilin family)
MTTIGPSLSITGEVTSNEDITIHGRVKGQIKMNGGALLVAPKANVEANVQGPNVTVHGALTGDIAAQRIELTPTAAVTGTLTGNSIVMQDGATFNGVIDMDRTKMKATVKSFAQPAA